MPPSQPTQMNWPAIGVVVIVVINITGWFVVHFLTKRREAERDRKLREEKSADDRKRQDEQSRTIFNSAICEFIAQVGKVDNHKFQDWFSNMQVSVEKQCALVESSISLDFRSRFASVRKECAKPRTQNDLMDDRAPVMQLPVGLDKLPEVTYQRGRKRAATILESLLDVCK